MCVLPVDLHCLLSIWAVPPAHARTGGAFHCVFIYLKFLLQVSRIFAVQSITKKRKGKQAEFQVFLKIYILFCNFFFLFRLLGFFGFFCLLR